MKEHDGACDCQVMQRCGALPKHTESFNIRARNNHYGKNAFRGLLQSKPIQGRTVPGSMNRFVAARGASSSYHLQEAGLGSVLGAFGGDSVRVRISCDALRVARPTTGRVVLGNEKNP